MNDYDYEGQKDYYTSITKGTIGDKIYFIKKKLKEWLKENKIFLYWILGLLALFRNIF